MNVSKISVTKRREVRDEIGTEITYTRLQVTFENELTKYVEFAHPINNKLIAAGFNAFAMALNIIK